MERGFLVEICFFSRLIAITTSFPHDALNDIAHTYQARTRLRCTSHDLRDANMGCAAQRRHMQRDAAPRRDARPPASLACNTICKRVDSQRKQLFVALIERRDDDIINRLFDRLPARDARQSCLPMMTAFILAASHNIHY